MKLALFALRASALIYCTVLLLLLFLENTLLYPAPKFPDGDWKADYLQHEDFEFASADGTQLHGWLLEHKNPQAVLLYCHGNGDSVANAAPYLDGLRRRHRLTIFVFDYRGYGKSAGSPSEQGILADGQAAQNWLANRAGIQPAGVVLMGRSLGGAVAIDLAANHGARGLILQNTPTSMPEAAQRIYWFLPVKWLMKNRYDSFAKIVRYHGPLFQSHGTSDSLVPFEMGRRLFDAAATANKKFFAVEGGDHNDFEPPEYDLAFAEFLASLPPASASELSP